MYHGIAKVCIFANKEYQADKINCSEPKEAILSLHVLQEEIQSTELRLQ